MRARRTDANHGEVAAAFERLGCSVWKVNDVVDLVIGYGGIAFLIEVKDGTKPPSAQKLTPREEKFRKSWTGGLYLIRNMQDVEKCVATMRSWVHGIQRKIMFETDVSKMSGPELTEWLKKTSPKVAGVCSEMRGDSTNFRVKK